MGTTVNNHFGVLPIILLLLQVDCQCSDGRKKLDINFMSISLISGTCLLPAMSLDFQLYDNNGVSHKFHSIATRLSFLFV